MCGVDGAIIGKQIPFAVARDYWPDLWQDTRELRKNNPPDEVNDG